MRKASAIELDDEQREMLLNLAQSNKAKVRLAQHAGIVLLAADGFGNADIGEMLDLGRVQVGRWRARYGRWRTPDHRKGFAARQAPPQG